MVKRTLLLATALLLSVTMACTTGGKWVAGGTVIGAATGACVGGIWAAAEGSLNAGEGAAIGAVTGGLAGALIGDVIGEYYDKAEFDRLNAENAALKAELDKCKADLAAANAKIAELQNELNKCREQLAKSIQRELEINLAADLLFKSGSAILSKVGKAKLDEAAQKITSQFKGKFVMIEGHTDSQPIKHSHWKTNWELGAARSLTVLHYLTSKGVDPALLSAATFSKYQPVADNGSKEGRAQNRRAMIVVYSNWPKK